MVGRLASALRILIITTRKCLFRMKKMWIVPKMISLEVEGGFTPDTVENGYFNS